MIFFIYACTASLEDTFPVQITPEEPPWTCPMTEEAEQIGTVQSTTLDELSGLAMGSRSDILWAHNDSGDIARIFALSLEGELLAEHTLPVQARDWEDMAHGIYEGNHHLYIADIGDNDEQYESISIHRLIEPSTSQSGELTHVDTFSLSYPDGAHNAESFVVHPHDQTFFVITKNIQSFSIYRWNERDQENIMQLHQELFLEDWDYEGSPLITAADITKDGKTLLLRTYTSVVAFDAKILQSSEDLVEMCIIESAPEQQGESIVLIEDTRYITISEGENPKIYSFAFSQRD